MYALENGQKKGSPMQIIADKSREPVGYFIFSTFVWTP
jgi:hypothetical protein